MKKKIFGGIALLAIAAMAAWNVNLNSQSNELSDISLANVEALANEGGTGPCPNGARQWDDPSFWYDDHTFITCGSCSQASGHRILYGC
jgi:hypothetical protein